MAAFAEKFMFDAVLKFMRESYGDISTLYNSAGYHNRHIDGMVIYAYLSGRFPYEPMSKCFKVVQDICAFVTVWILFFLIQTGDIGLSGNLKNILHGGKKANDY